MQRKRRFRPFELTGLKKEFAFIDKLLGEFQSAIFQDGTITATEAIMKMVPLLFAVSALLVAAAGCNQSNSADKSPVADTNSSAQNAQESASKAWQDTKGAATNAWNVAKIGATNAWNRTTNAIH